MSWSFNITGGDLSLGGPGGLSTVTGTQKLTQDLRCWLLEPMGTDPLHADYGSTLDGGTLPDGTTIETNIGADINDTVLVQTESEVRRVLSAYQAQQIARIQDEQAIYDGKTTLVPTEILYNVAAVDTSEVNDAIVVRVQVQTSNGTNLIFAQPVGNF